MRPVLMVDQPPAEAGVAIRPARPEDVPALVDLEERAFSTDRLTRRNFQYMLTRGRAICLVAEQHGELVGYALVLLRRGTSLARLYSLAVDARMRRTGLGRRLLKEAEAAALRADALFLRLEVRADNGAAIRLYERQGYRAFGRYLDYYEDHAEALRLEKRLDPKGALRDVPLPYYHQTTGFTCGPAALMMVMKALDPSIPLNRQLEFRLWREATTIFMASGHGGCCPFGLALAAHRRGFKAHIFLSSNALLFLDSVRSALKKEVMRLAQLDFRSQAAETDIEIAYRPLAASELTSYVDAGFYPLILISLYRMYGDKEPHWIVVHGYDDRFIYAHDPLIEHDRMDVAADKINMPIPRAEFERMARFGKTKLRAALVIERRPEGRA